MASTLHTLAETTCDSVKGYRNAAEKANSPQLKQQLQQCAQTREQTLQKLNDALRQMGEEPVVDGTTLGNAHQAFLSIADAFESGDEAATERVEEGEDYLKSKFESALKDDDLDPRARQVVQEAYQEIQQGERFSDQLARQYD